MASPLSVCCCVAGPIPGLPVSRARASKGSDAPVAFELDAAYALDPGGRAYQEDAVSSEFPHDARVGWTVLSDGMGGHAAGDVASALVVTEVQKVLARADISAKTAGTEIVEHLHAAAASANGAIRTHVQSHPETDGMGATLLAVAVIEDALHWISIGDSPLFLYRGGRLQQLNEDHSMAPQLDFMVDAGLLDAEEARHHPDRNALTSVLIGADIPKIDCPETPTTLKSGDIIIVASDGVQALSDAQLQAVLGRCRGQSSQDIAQNLISSVTALDDPDLDNVSVSVLQVCTSPGKRVQPMPVAGKISLFDRVRRLMFQPT